MLKKAVNRQKAQVIASEYVLVIFLVMAAMTAMSVYFKRSIQARIYAARKGMVNYVVDHARNLNKGGGVDATKIVGLLSGSYEPYYLESNSEITRNSLSSKILVPSFQRSTGIYRETVDQTTGVKMKSRTAPAKDYEEGTLE